MLCFQAAKLKVRLYATYIIHDVLFPPLRARAVATAGALTAANVNVIVEITPRAVATCQQV